MDDDTSQAGNTAALPDGGAPPGGRRRRRREVAAAAGTGPQEAPAAATPSRRRKRVRAERGAHGPNAGGGPVPTSSEGPPGPGAGATPGPPGPVSDSPVPTPPTPAPARRGPVRPVAAAVAVVLGLGVGSVLTVDDEASPSVADYAAGEGGEVLVARDGRFRARFPSTPARRTQSVQVEGASVPVVDYTGNAGGQTFTVSFAELPQGQEVGDPILRLNASATAAAKAVKGELESAGITSFQGQPAVEYLIAVEGRYVKATSFLVGRRVYGIEVVGPANPPAGYQRFRDTFELTA